MQLLMLINFCFLLQRLFHRVFFTSHIYGALHGLLAIPRLLVSNLINYFAVSRAIGIFVDSKLTGRKIVWDKTAHTFPTGHGSAMAQPPAAPMALPPAAPEGHQMPTVTAH
jgi:adsorption protein B